MGGGGLEQQSASSSMQEQGREEEEEEVEREKTSFFHIHGFCVKDAFSSAPDILSLLLLGTYLSSYRGESRAVFYMK